MDETSTLELDFFSSEYIIQMYDQIKNKVYLPLSQKYSFPSIKKFTQLSSKEIKESAIQQIDDLNIFIHFSDEIAFPSNAFFNNETYISFEASFSSQNHLDNYALHFLKWLKTINTDSNYYLFFETNCHVFYIKHMLDLLTMWCRDNNLKGKILLIIPETTRLLYTSSFSSYKQSEIPNAIEVNTIGKKWQNYGFSEKAILITTCFLHGLSLHQFRQVISNLLKLKDRLEEQDKTERKLLGNYTAKWEKNYDQILRDCQLTTLRQAGQPAKIGFKNPEDAILHTNYIEEEYPIFLQEFFELLIYAVFPQLIKEYEAIFKSIIGMHAHLASNHKDYRDNMRPIDLIVSFITEESDSAKRTKLAASLINEMLLHEELKHHAYYTYELISKSAEDNTSLLNSIISSSCGQSVQFCISIWSELLQTSNKEKQQKIFKNLIDSALINKSLLQIFTEKIKRLKFQVEISDSYQHSFQLSFYQTFLIYFFLENANRLEVSLKENHLPSDLILAKFLAFNFPNKNLLEELLHDLIKIDLSNITEDKSSYRFPALIFEEWYYAMHSFSGKNHEAIFPELSEKLAKKISELPAIKEKINKKNLLRSWQYLSQELLEFAATLPHSQYQELIALNTKRKIMITLINNFRNL